VVTDGGGTGAGASLPIIVIKGDGPSLMISDMLTSEWGCLSDGNE
jgi:hypothetical protein